MTPETITLVRANGWRQRLYECVRRGSVPQSILRHGKSWRTGPTAEATGAFRWPQNGTQSKGAPRHQGTHPGDPSIEWYERSFYNHLQNASGYYAQGETAKAEHEIQQCIVQIEQIEQKLVGNYK